jgi:hypothetical protein
MNFLISESQLKLILTENVKSSMRENMLVLNSFATDLVNRVRRRYGLNLKLLLTWGTSFGGLIMPLNNFIEKGNFELDDYQKALILIGATVILYFDNKSLTKKLISKIKEEGLIEPFEKVLGKGYELRKAFMGFMNSLGTSVNSFSEIVSYAFLIPIITDVYDAILKVDSLSVATENIVERLLASGVILVGSEVLNEVIKSIGKRFKKG